MFEEVFSNFLKKRSVYVFRDRLGISEKTVYSWCYPNHTPHGRKDPITRAVEVLDVIFHFEPEVGFHALAEIATRYGFRLELIEQGEVPDLPKLHKELTDVTQAELEAQADGRLTPEEIDRCIQEIREAELTLARRKAYFLQLKEKIGR